METIGVIATIEIIVAIWIGGFAFIWGIMKIATPSWGGDFVLFVLLLVLFEELGDEGGDFFCFMADAVVFAFDDGEL